ncbi:MAG: AAA family ATPase, partial [Paludibacteraceae bacterium]|nr:AAA family ATPase [Paludibacteraceae bacterium]
MKYPIGIQTFEKIIEGGYVYVDKTDLVYKLVTTGEYYFLSRPRRFGKSLLTTTLEAYFLGKKELFRGLAMEKLEQDWVEYPVFHIDFSGADYTNPGMVCNRINTYLAEWEKKYGRNDVEVATGDRLFGVISRAKEQTGKQVVILIDEYDKPLTDTIGKPEIQDKNRSTLQEIYGIMKRADRHIRFAFLTGVTRYGKLGI